MCPRVLALLLPALLVGAACKGSERPDSLLPLALDTTRADRLGSYGRAHAGTPALARELGLLEADGERFDADARSSLEAWRTER